MHFFWASLTPFSLKHAVPDGLLVMGPLWDFNIVFDNAGAPPSPRAIATIA